MKALKAPAILLLLLATLLTACTVLAPLEREGRDPSKLPREIKVAYDPNKGRLFDELLAAYNARAAVKVQGVKLDIPQMLEALPSAGFVAISPDSAIWLESLDRAWQEARPGASSIVGTTIRYATTPVAIATWRGRESELGAGDERGWATLLQRSSRDASYRWSHGSPRASASGMLALVAEFYAGAGKTYGLTKADADHEDVRRYVAQIEKTIARYGGESDAALVEYLLKEGQTALAAIVMPEASVFDFNQRSKGSKLYAIHPAEGTLMLDHPLILLETPELTPEQRRAFLEFARFLTGADGQAIVVKHGYRPIDLAFDVQKSPLGAEGLSAGQPRLLQMPAAGTLTYLRAAWASGLKRRANIILVVDVSGSMQGDKLQRTKEALTSFLKQVPSDEERVGLATFSSDFREVVPLGRLGDNRQQLLAQVDQLKAEGNTALFYAVWRAHRLLAQRADAERINVVVAMTDGIENASPSFSQRNVRDVGTVPQIVGRSVKETGPLVNALKKNGAGILIFTVAYGSDADLNMLGSLASAFGGQGYGADPNTIRKLYELISQNF
ncbi:MAG: substrate-binding domain-containing protein [Chloroflexi bacterium]|nr:substrate-binding domain-containing protein [Chloroflexota bacterium]